MVAGLPIEHVVHCGLVLACIWRPRREYRPNYVVITSSGLLLRLVMSGWLASSLLPVIVSC